ncbi:hypothetical protein [Psychrobacter fozii]|uniref:Uncharacterized protein n=1 Tax=Psychrobacter fozii TaxID=198480 RepID=A0A2V4UZ95_9GAMM|nr:hypothetical protein [Psychrobacter fozii]PYE38861.1 hypothetical protein DFP82_10514 [Psychrobacter fozii]
MTQFYLRTANDELATFDWVSIKRYIMDLPYSNEEHIVLGSLLDDNSYIQTRINIETYRTDGLYDLEVRIPVAIGFKHYQRCTNDTCQVIDSFFLFHNNQPVDISLYQDITAEFDLY